MGVILYPPTIDWSWMKQRPQHLMDQFAKNGHTVFYFNKSGASGGPVYERIAPNLYLVHHAEYFVRHLWPRMRPDRGTLYWTSWSRQLQRGASEYGADFIVYDCVDDFPDWEQDEKRYIEQADAVVCTADTLERKMRALAPAQPVIQAPNGCDWDFFRATMDRNADKPLTEVPDTGGPVIGYIGAWAPWVDESIVVTLGERLPHARIVIVGPKLREDTTVYPSNVYFMGYQEYSSLPDILPHVDVCIIPFHVNRITRSTNPIKVYEYLAAGKPVVSTNLPEVRKMSPYVSIAEDPEDFAAQVQSLLASPEHLREERSRYAQSFSWSNRYQHIARHLRTWYPELDELTAAPRLIAPPDTLDIPLAHQTVNSYYKDTVFHQEPPWVGRMPGGEYRFVVRVEQEKVPPEAERVYLEFDAACRSEEDITVHVGISSETCPSETLCYGTLPAFTAIGSIRANDRLNDTFSFDITGPLRQYRTLTLELSSAQAVLTHLGRPRLTCFMPNKP